VNSERLKAEPPVGQDGEPRPPRRILPAIVFSQFAGTSLWFAGNAVIEDLRAEFGLAPEALADLTAAVQFGFISGTLTFAFLTLADRYSPRAVFLACAWLGAACNLGLLWADGAAALFGFRFATGFFLAGVYPVGMKIAASWHRAELGKAIGFLVGALVLGTAFPHLARGLGEAWPWRTVIAGVSALAAAGGAALWLLVPDGPLLGRTARFDPRALAIVFRAKRFRSAAFGYFGHMWELYAFWAFAPVWLAAYIQARPGMDWSISLASFGVIGIGSVGCVLAGLWSVRRGSAPAAVFCLTVSGACCLVSPLMFAAPPFLFIAFLAMWGMAVIGDSAQFSALAAHTAPREWVGSALTIVNCLGFALTILSIQLTGRLAEALPPQWLLCPLAAGPILGLLAARRLLHGGAVPL